MISLLDAHHEVIATIRPSRSDAEIANAFVLAAAFEMQDLLQEIVSAYHGDDPLSVLGRTIKDRAVDVLARSNGHKLEGPSTPIPVWPLADAREGYELHLRAVSEVCVGAAAKIRAGGTLEPDAIYYAVNSLCNAIDRLDDAEAAAGVGAWGGAPALRESEVFASAVESDRSPDPGLGAAPQEEQQSSLFGDSVAEMRAGLRG